MTTGLHKRLHSKLKPTWADLIALVAAIGTASLPELIDAHEPTWGHLLSPQHMIPAALPALAVLGAWSNKFRSS